jgi:hypothetical protein
MKGSPSNISHEEVKRALRQIRRVTGVFELHIWNITSGVNALFLFPFRSKMGSFHYTVILYFETVLTMLALLVNR